MLDNLMKPSYPLVQNPPVLCPVNERPPGSPASSWCPK